MKINIQTIEPMNNQAEFFLIDLLRFVESLDSSTFEQEDLELIERIRNFLGLDD